ncbi:alpha carbonic anhydrase 7-like protein [Tanacetum coccineum]
MGKLHKKWSACNIGKMQSPIDLSNSRVDIVYKSKKLRNYIPCTATLNNRGHESRYSLELHMVHKSIDPTSKHQIAVIGVLYKIGKPNLFLSKTPRGDRSTRDQNELQKVLQLHWFTHCASMYRTEGVIWTISKKVRTVSLDQVKLLREAVHDHAAKNARPLQPDHQRDIQLIGSDDD